MIDRMYWYVCLWYWIGFDFIFMRLICYWLLIFFEMIDLSGGLLVNLVYCCVYILFFVNLFWI